MVWDEYLSAENWDALRDILPDYMTNEQTLTLLEMTGEDLASIYDTTANLVQQELDTGITNDMVENVSATLQEKLTRQLRLSYEQELWIENLLKNDLTANSVFNEQATQGEKDNIAASVPEIEYKTGQNIVMKGDIVTNNH